MLDHRPQDHVACGLRLVAKIQGQRCYATFFCESDCSGRITRISRLVPFFGCDDAFWRFELEADAAHSHFASVRIAPHVAEGITRLECDLADREGSTGF